MPSPAKKYRPREPVIAAKVAKPYKQVADWCNGRVITRYGPGSTVLGIEVEGAFNEKIFVMVGDYIGEDPAHVGMYVKYFAEDFEKYFERIPNGSENL